MESNTARKATALTALAIAGATAGLLAGATQAQAITPIPIPGAVAITPIPIPGSLRLPPGYRIVAPGGGIGPVSG
ncbi:MAG: hypothetical protein JHC95_13675 [Solirubrobacteraceae bacterium]|nr:hypothetical protein [Solirubrobacteraceae bacterium]